MRYKLLSIVAVSSLLLGCAAHLPGRAVYVLVDTSGSYIHEVPKANKIIRYLIGTLEPGDTIAVGRITSLSFTNHERVAAVTLSLQPATADAQKRGFATSITAFVQAMAHRKGSSYTDISGAFLEAGHFLASIPAQHKDIIVVSDMRQDLPPHAVRHLTLPLQGIQVFAVNVITSHGENMNPARYMARMHRWDARVTRGGGHFIVVHELTQLPALLRTH